MDAMARWWTIQRQGLGEDPIASAGAWLHLAQLFGVAAAKGHRQRPTIARLSRRRSAIVSLHEAG